MKSLSRGTEMRGPPHQVVGDSLRIDCTSCNGPSMPTDASCIRCICFVLIGNPSVERVMVRQYDDRVIRGDAVSVLKDIAFSLSVIATVEGGTGWRCSKCPSSPSTMVAKAWEAFPELPAAIIPPSRMGRDCRVCLDRMQNALERSRLMYDAGTRRASYLAFNRVR